MSTQALPAELAEAVAALHEAFPGRVLVDALDPAGVTVRISPVALSERWTPRVGELWFVIPFHFPDAPIYPYYVLGATTQPGVVPAFQIVPWRGRQVVQVSLRNNAWDPSRDSAEGCVLQVQDFLERT